MRLISLFSGAGGMDEGFQRAGFTTLYAMDKDPAAVETHRHNHPQAQALELDITKLVVADLIAEWERRSPGQPPVGVIGGPPCQSFSYANTNQTDDDPRHSLPGHYARILRGLNRHYGLDFFVFENVLGLKGLHREKWERFKAGFRAAGFRLFEQELEAWQYGAPQLRPRLFLVGVNTRRFGRKFAFQFPPPLHSKETWRTVADVLRGLPEPTYFQKDLTRERIPFHPNHWCMNPRSPKFQEGLFNRPGKYGKSFAVLDWNKPSLTVAYGHREVHIHPNGHRRLSVYEAMLLQGFGPHYELRGTLSDQIRLVSDAVSPPVAEQIALALRRQLYGSLATPAAAGAD